MKRTFALATAIVAALAFAGQANAGEWRHHRGHHVDKRLAAVAIGTSAAATVGYFAINDWKWKWNNGSSLTSLAAYGATTMGCAAVAPMVATVVLNRPLTMREGHTLIGSCVVPIIGGWLVSEAYDAHPNWEPATAPAPRARRHHRHAMK